MGTGGQNSDTVPRTWPQERGAQESQSSLVGPSLSFRSLGRADPREYLTCKSLVLCKGADRVPRALRYTITGKKGVGGP